MTGRSNDTPRILLVDDNATNLQVLYQTLDGQGYRLLAARSGRDALAIAARAVPDLVLLDVMMPEMDGYETCARLKADPRTRDSAVIFLSALTETTEKVRGLELGAVDFVNKPFQAEEVLARVRTHLEIRRLQQELRARSERLAHELSVAQELLREARDRTDGVLLGDSTAAVRLRQDVADAAACDDTLLVSGPSGSDHEAVARAIHHQSARATHAIICVKCAMVPGPELFDKWPLARGGTLYLEGIQHLPWPLQRALTDRISALDAARRAGQTPDPDVRVMVSTTRDVDEEIAAGRLVPELHRVLPKTVDLVPLRSRLEDLPALAGYILRQQAEHAGQLTPTLSGGALARLQSYRWPGNLHQLRYVLGSALASSHGPVLEIGEHLLDSSVRVGSYRLLERLGAGGMGEVWLGRHQMLARPAAIKIVREASPGSVEDASALRERFAREAQATAELQSPHTVQLFDFGITDTGSFYYVMERLRGLDLQRMVERHGPLPPGRVAYLLAQACLSLSEAHALGLVHRDIKPANLFACRLGAEYDFLKVLDFGVVARRGTAAMTITGAGVVLGTPAFIAPELVPGHGPFDARADIYALGCVAFWLLTGRAPFEADDPATMLRHHASTAARPPSSLRDGIPPEVDEIVLACLAKDPTARPATVDLLAERLEQQYRALRWDRHQAREWWEQHEPEAAQRDEVAL